MTIGRTLVLRLLSLVLIAGFPLSCQASVPPVEIGMTMHSRGADAAAIAQQFDLMAAMNVTWVRVDFDWSVAESQRGQFNWEYPDAIVAEAAAHGMKVLGVLSSSPEWARPSTQGRSTDARHSRPENLSEWAAFAKVVTERYAPRGVHNWEIWNEPNTQKFWPPRPDVNEYGTLFWVAAEAIREVDEQATILIGGLAPKFHVPDSEVAPTDYLEQLYQNGAIQLADGIAVHPYTFPALPFDTPQRAVGGFKDLPELRAVMESHGDSRKKIWITEFGAPTGTGPHAVSDGAQATMLLQARREVQQWDWAGPLIYYELVDGGTDLADVEENFGVLRHDLSPKPAADALMDLAPR
ncbi:GH39 family glycosyl hydrolase [Mycobacterium sp. 29Ha]|uniref:GH39 family glycosyl hydrolase n=1 Tax=Mycobacterium sp. 29Ha TaxID=2939268 RepID=UPI002938DA12|nr:cellulase family glycosylhydrolase [Mycobacterium sp. 29Ha]MDV3134729.1 cellulase family glycosylhydrolase [Mycobacterium sp. 29Ha]